MVPLMERSCITVLLGQLHTTPLANACQRDWKGCGVPDCQCTVLSGQFSPFFLGWEPQCHGGKHIEGTTKCWNSFQVKRAVISLARNVSSHKVPLPGRYGGGIAGLAVIPANWRRLPPIGVHCYRGTHPVVSDFKVRARGADTRLITDCRVLNKHLNPHKFKLEHIWELVPFSKNGVYAEKVDLKPAYFNLELASKEKEYGCIPVAPKGVRFEAGCFGLFIMSEVFMRLMKTSGKKVFSKKW